MKADKELEAYVRAALKALTPEGTRLVVDEFGQVRVFCNGEDRTFAYVCCLDPGHKGRCYCEYKRIDFTPDSRS